jgi:hypothetical protein
MAGDETDAANEESRDEHECRYSRQGVVIPAGMSDDRSRPILLKSWVNTRERKFESRHRHHRQQKVTVGCNPIRLLLDATLRGTFSTQSTQTSHFLVALD